jgi:hypothetical protein
MQTSDVQVDVIALTDAAVLVRIANGKPIEADDIFSGSDDDEQTWLPLSQILGGDKLVAGARDITIEIPTWLAEDRGL